MDRARRRRAPRPAGDDVPVGVLPLERVGDGLHELVDRFLGRSVAALWLVVHQQPLSSSSTGTSRSNVQPVQPASTSFPTSPASHGPKGPKTSVSVHPRAKT